MDSGLTPVVHSEPMSDPTLETGESLGIAVEIVTLRERIDMKVGTKVMFSRKLKAQMKVTLVMITLSLLGFGAGLRASIGLSFHITA